MNPKHMFHDLVLGIPLLQKRYPARGPRGWLHKPTGDDIPEDLLPGRTVMRMNEQTRSQLRRLQSGDLENVAPWWIKIMTSRPPVPADIESKMVEIERGYQRRHASEVK